MLRVNEVNRGLRTPQSGTASPKPATRSGAGRKKGERSEPRASTSRSDSAARSLRPSGAQGAGRKKGERSEPRASTRQGQTVHGTWPACSGQRPELHGPNKFGARNRSSDSAARSLRPSGAQGAGRKAVPTLRKRAYVPPGKHARLGVSKVLPEMREGISPPAGP